MKPLTRTCAIVAAVAATGLHLFAADNAKLRYAASIYADAAGNGLQLPEAVACGANGQIVVGDSGNNRLLRFTYADKTLSGGSEIKNPQLTAPVRIAIGSKGDLYVLDGARHRVVHLTAQGELAGIVSFAGAPPPDTVLPKGVAVDTQDNLYVLDVFSARVLVMNAAGQYQRALALPAEAGFATDVTVDTNGTVFVVDSLKRRLFAAAKDATAFSAVGGDLSSVLATLPTSLTTMPGVIFVVEGSGSTIVAFRRDGTFLSRQLSQGWDEGLLNHPEQMCVTAKGDVFVADRDNSRIEVFELLR